METWKLLDGEVQVRDEGHSVWFRVDCKPPCELTRLLRCYCEGSNFLVGVLEPVGGRLTLERRVSRETLRQAGVEKLPSRFYLSDGDARAIQEAPIEISMAEEVLEVVPEAGTSPLESADEPKQADPEPAAKPARADAPSESAPGLTEAPPPDHQDAGNPPQPDPAGLKTGDALLDEALARGEIYCEQTAQGFRISCPFSSTEPFPLAFIAPLCRIEHRLAVLDWSSPQASQKSQGDG